MAHDAAASLSHSDGFGGAHVHTLFHCGKCDELGGKDCSLTAYAAQKTIFIIHSVTLSSLGNNGSAGAYLRTK